MRRRSVLAGLVALMPATACAEPVPGPNGATEHAYGLHPRQRLDLYPRPKGSGAPVLLFVHGGGWAAGDKRDVFALPAFAERHGFLLASTNYRFAPEADAGAQAADVAAAARWLFGNARRYGGDPERIFLVGHSSGGHLAALAAVGRYGLRRRRILLGGVVTVDGSAFDVADAMARMGVGRLNPLPPIPQMFVNAFGDRAEALSPSRLLQSDLRYPPFLLLTAPGTLTTSEALSFATLLRAAGGAAETLAAPGDTHMGLLQTLGAPGDPEGERVAAFLRTGRL